MSQATLIGGDSATAQYLADKMSEHQRFLHKSAAIGMGDVIREELAEVWEECREPNWDGYNAFPVTQDALRYTYMFLEALPFGFPRPSIAADPHGHFSLEWYRTPRRLVSLGISPDGFLHYAALLGPKSKTCGTEAFFGEVPDIILDLVRRVFA